MSENISLHSRVLILLSASSSRPFVRSRSIWFCIILCFEAMATQTEGARPHHFFAIFMSVPSSTIFFSSLRSSFTLSFGHEHFVLSFFCIHLNKFPLIVNNLQNYVRIYYFLSSFSFRSLGRWLECFFARVTTKQEYVFFEMFVSMFLSSFFSPLLSSYWTQNDLLWRPHCIALIALIHLANVRVVCYFIFRRAFFITFKKS